MESLNDTTWDVMISGTGLPQSLLALALSRSGKKVLHLDQNDYYGGAEAAFSLQEATDWVGHINLASKPTPFSAASITQHQIDEGLLDPRLGFSRAYSISLSPHLIYARSNLVPALVSSKVYRQLEFLAVGSWWIYDAKEERQEGAPGQGGNTILQGQNVALRKIPGSREDVFADKSIDLRSTRSLMKVLKLAADAEAHSTIVSESGDQSLPDFLASHYKIGSKLQAPLQALTLSPAPPSRTIVAYAVPQLHRHLTSIGIFGPGFGAVVPKWGGLAEIAQVACRAGAVGGGVYVLKKGIESIDKPVQPSASPTSAEGTDHLLSAIKLQGGDEVKARWIIGTPSTLHGCSDEIPKQQMMSVEVTHITAIVSSSLTSLFPPPAEGSPPPASTVAALPPGTIRPPQSVSLADVPALYLIIHSSDTGECPEGQSIIYTSTALSHPSALQFLSSAIEAFLFAVPGEAIAPDILWTLAYRQRHLISSSPPHSNAQKSPAGETADHKGNQRCGILHLHDLSPSLALEDDVLKDVRAVWERVTADDGNARGGFMQFEDRVGFGDEDDEDV
ncbi:MAG: hypothetical protein L6R38_003429 [Xanthoria sp. 2 TBL-2021]|nr:MAG: hypothetical protein L6R38_003429 [Xanthoria sp. 2 TBL-2021]